MNENWHRFLSFAIFQIEIIVFVKRRRIVVDDNTLFRQKRRERFFNQNLNQTLRIMLHDEHVVFRKFQRIVLNVVVRIRNFVLIIMFTKNEKNLLFMLSTFCALKKLIVVRIFFFSFRDSNVNFVTNDDVVDDFASKHATKMWKNQHRLCEMKFSTIDESRANVVRHFRNRSSREFRSFRHSYANSKTFESNRHRRVSRCFKRRFQFSSMFASIEKTQSIANVDFFVNRHFVVDEKKSFFATHVISFRRNSIVSQFYHSTQYSLSHASFDELNVHFVKTRVDRFDFQHFQKFIKKRKNDDVLFFRSKRSNVD